MFAVTFFKFREQFTFRVTGVINDSILGKTFSLSREHMEANCGSTLLSRLVFRRTRDQERMAIQWATTLKSCSGQ